MPFILGDSENLTLSKRGPWGPLNHHCQFCRDPRGYPRPTILYRTISTYSEAFLLEGWVRCTRFWDSAPKCVPAPLPGC